MTKNIICDTSNIITTSQVNLKLFTPAAGKRRTVLLFVFRDRTRTPLVRLVEAWDQDLARLWAAIPKPPEYDGTSVADFFEVSDGVTKMPSFLIGCHRYFVHAKPIALSHRNGFESACLRVSFLLTFHEWGEVGRRGGKGSWERWELQVYASGRPMIESALEY